MFLAKLLILLLGFCDTLHVKLIPELINGVHYGRVPECEIPCEFSADPQNSDAEFYIVGNDEDVLNALRSGSEHPIKILGIWKGLYYHNLINIESLITFFHASSLQDRRSDIPWIVMPDMDKLKVLEMPQNPKPKASIIAKNCEVIDVNINDYIRIIDEVIGVVSPSTCLNNTEWPQCGEVPCTKLEVIRNYTFHLAFESGNFPGSATENIYEAMEAGVVPVYLGTRDVAEAVPKGSYIDASDFDTPYDVANYLKEVLDNETMYNSYFEWKYKPFDQKFDRKNRAFWGEDHYCRVCYYVDAIIRDVRWNHFYQRAEDRIPGKWRVTNIFDKIYRMRESHTRLVSKKYPENDCEWNWFPLLYTLKYCVIIFPAFIILFLLFRKYRFKIRFAVRRFRL